MLANNTTYVPSANGTELRWPWEDDMDDAIVLIVLYYIMGILAILTNSLLLHNLYKQRKHGDNLSLFGFIAGCAIYGFSYTYTAVYRTYVIIAKPDGIIILVCMAYMPFFTIGNTLGCLSLLVVAFERFLAVATSSLYKKFQQRKVRLLTALLVLLLTLGDLLFSWIVVADILYSIASPFCFTEEFMPTNYFDFHLFLNFSIGLATCFIFAFSFCTLKCSKTSNPELKPIRERRTAVVSKRLAQLLLFKIFIQVIPTVLYLVSKHSALAKASGVHHTKQKSPSRHQPEWPILTGRFSNQMSNSIVCYLRTCVEAVGRELVIESQSSTRCLASTLLCNAVVLNLAQVCCRMPPC